MKSLKSLLPSTEKVLIKISSITILEEFTFVGGSALAVYLNHRKSEDIDLFTWKNSLDFSRIQMELTRIFNREFNIINKSETQLDCVCSGVKITFFANNWNALAEKELLINHIHIAKIELLTAMKINTLFLRAKFRDYYDLYVLHKECFTLEQFFTFAKKYIPSINVRLFQTALVFVADIEDDSIAHLEPKYKITKEKISQYFEKEIKKWIQNRNEN